MLIKRMRKNKKKGFTLVELIIVIAVIAILAVVMTTAFSGVTDKALVSTVQNQVSEDINEVTVELKSHESGSCLCGGNKQIYECPSIAGVLADNGYTGYVYKTTTADRDKDFYIAVDGKDIAQCATWVGDYSELAAKTGIMVLDYQGKPLYAIWRRGNKYYFYTQYKVAFEDSVYSYTPAVDATWAMSVGRIAEFGDTNVDAIADTSFDVIDVA